MKKSSLDAEITEYNTRISIVKNELKTLQKDQKNFNRDIKNLNLESDYSISQEMLLKILPSYKYKQIPIHVSQRQNGSSFIRVSHYFYKMIFMVFKYLLFPRIKVLTDFLFSEKTRRKVSFYCLRT